MINNTFFPLTTALVAAPYQSIFENNKWLQPLKAFTNIAVLLQQLAGSNYRPHIILINAATQNNRATEPASTAVLPCRCSTTCSKTAQPIASPYLISLFQWGYQYCSYITNTQQLYQVLVHLLKTCHINQNDTSTAFSDFTNAANNLPAGLHLLLSFSFFGVYAPAMQLKPHQQWPPPYPASQLSGSSSCATPQEYIFLKEGRKRVQVLLKNIITITSADDYVLILQPGNKKLLCLITLKEMEEKLYYNPLFIRVNHYTIINRMYIDWVKGDLIKTTYNHDVTLTRKYATAFKEKMEI